ncbi:MAG TPA: beta-aspartyl-peptidase, partial [Candidatus Kapabacteria bacterium]|nr:beta-aspartyl-peptidase [Candidatus Kapabacteria bacterium]
EQQVTMAIQSVTSNVARILKLETKGRIIPGCDADLLVLKKDRSGIRHLFAKGVRRLEFEK